jgi:hypothetical protein
MKRLLSYLFIVLGLGLTFNVSADAITGKGLCISGLIKGSTTANVTKLKNINKVIPGLGKCSEKEFLSKKKYPSEYKKLKKMVGSLSSSKPIPLIKILYVINNTDIFDKYIEEKKTTKNQIIKKEPSQTQKVAGKEKIIAAIIEQARGRVTSLMKDSPIPRSLEAVRIIANSDKDKVKKVMDYLGIEGTLSDILKQEDPFQTLQRIQTILDSYDDIWHGDLNLD